MKHFKNRFRIEGEIETTADIDFSLFCDKFTNAIKILDWRFTGFFEDMLADNAELVRVVRCENCNRWKEHPVRHNGVVVGWCSLFNESTHCNFYCQQGMLKRKKEANESR